MPGVSGVLPAAAAGIAFAADVSAGVRLTTDVFGYDKANGVSAFTIKHENEFYHAPITFSVSSEKAGGTLKLTDKSGGAALTGKWNIWFAPVDALKFNVGVWTNTLNQEMIDWSNSDSGIGIDDNANFVLTIAPFDGFSLDAVVASDFGKAWFRDKRKIASDALSSTDGWGNKSDSEKNDLIDAYLTAHTDIANIDIQQVGLMMHFGADFGTVSAMFKAENSFKTLTFGAGYKNTFGPATVFVNALGTYANDAFSKIRAEVYAEVPVDSLKVQAFVVGGYNLKGGYDASWWHIGQSGADKKAFVGASAKLSYAMGDVTPYLYVKDVNFLADNFDLEIKPGITFKVGDCAIEAALDVHAKEYFSFSVPVSFQVAF